MNSIDPANLPLPRKICKNEADQFEAFHYGCLIGEFPTAVEAEQALMEEDKSDKDFVEINKISE